MKIVRARPSLTTHVFVFNGGLPSQTSSSIEKRKDSLPVLRSVTLAVIEIGNCMRPCSTCEQNENEIYLDFAASTDSRRRGVAATALFIASAVPYAPHAVGGGAAHGI